MSALSSAPRMVAQMRSALAQVRSFVPKLETTIQDAMPQIAQASAMLKNLSADFADTGEGGFHLSRKDLADPSYRHVRESMFSSDGTATRLFLYSDGQLDLAAAARAQQLEIAAGKAMKYGSLVDSQVTVGGAAQIAAAVRDALIHDAVLLAVILLTVVALASMWRGAVHGAAVGVGVLASYLAALGVSIALWQHLLDRELNAWSRWCRSPSSLRAASRISLRHQSRSYRRRGNGCAVQGGGIRAGSGCAACGARWRIRRWPGAGVGRFLQRAQSDWHGCCARSGRADHGAASVASDHARAALTACSRPHATLGWPTTITHRRHHTW